MLNETEDKERARRLVKAFGPKRVDESAEQYTSRFTRFAQLAAMFSGNSEIEDLARVMGAASDS